MKSTACLTRMVGGSVEALQNAVTRSGWMSTMSIPASQSPTGSFIKDGNRFGQSWLRQGPRRSMRSMTMYQVTDQLHDGHVARVSGSEIAATVSSWLADLGAHSPLVDELARAVRNRDWPAAYVIGETLSVHVAVAI